MTNDVCFFGMRTEDVEWIKRDEGGTVDLKFKFHGNHVRMFLSAGLVRMIGALATPEDYGTGPTLEADRKQVGA